MRYLQRRQYKKLVKQILHEGRHARHMRADRADPADLEKLDRAEQGLLEAWNGRADAETLDRAMEQLVESARVVLPPRSQPRIREFVEIGVVAIAVAMGFRTYFIQPFKIPTQSMEPTLYGIKVDRDAEAGWMDKPPMRYVKFLTTGKRHLEVKASTSGPVEFVEDRISRKQYIRIRGRGHRYFGGMEQHVSPGQYVEKGQLLASGTVTAGDHIFVDKIRYNFVKPKRGQIVVFRTEAIQHPEIQKTDHYIKRLVGLPGEVIALRPPHLIVNGQPVTEPEPFERLLSTPYHGYNLAQHRRPPRPLLSQSNDRLKLGDDEYLMFGDNTDVSLDGRYFGGVPQHSLIGPAFAVYWPFGPRWGRAR